MVTADPCAQVRLELGTYLLGSIEPAQRALVTVSYTHLTLPTILLV